MACSRPAWVNETTLLNRLIRYFIPFAFSAAVNETDGLLKG